MKKSFLSPGTGPSGPPKRPEKSPNRVNRFENRKVPLGTGKSLMDWIRYSNSGLDLAGTKGKPLKVTEQDMAKHCSRNNAWTILHDKVFNITPYLEYHPGGVDQLMRVAGTDGTDLFNRYHKWVSWQSMLSNCFVGNFVGNHAKLKAPGPDPDECDQCVFGLSLTDGPNSTTTPNSTELTYTTCKLLKTIVLTPDTKMFVLEFPQSWQQSNGLPPIGSHVFLSLKLSDGENLVRPYTPVISRFGGDESTTPLSSENDLSRNLCFIIKIYPNGTFTKHLNTLKPGIDNIGVSEPRIPFKMDIISKLKKFYLFAAGTGITPMIRLIDFFSSKIDHEVKLYFFNKSENDIIWAKEFDDLALKSPVFDVVHILSQPSNRWKGLTGRISDQLIEKFGLNVSKLDLKLCFAFVCGPAAFNETCFNVLLKSGWPKDKIFVFQET